MATLQDYVRLFIVTSLLKIVTCNYKEVMMFQMICNDDLAHIGSLSTDCNKFLICSQGMTLGFSCPQGYVFNDFVMRCHLPSRADKSRCSKLLLNTMPFTCLQNPNARVASYLSCAQYFDCGARPSSTHRFTGYVTECPYPQLFSPETGRCEPFQRVQCVGRTEPKAPCDYLQYQQLCEGPSCPPCPKRHPSCVGLPDGAHSVGKISRIYVVCLAERTVNIGICKENYVFSDAKATCVTRASLVPPIRPLSSNQLAALFAGFSNVAAAANRTLSAMENSRITSGSSSSSSSRSSNRRSSGSNSYNSLSNSLISIASSSNSNSNSNNGYSNGDGDSGSNGGAGTL